MKQRGAEVTYRIWNNKDKNTLVRPGPWAKFFLKFFFISCVVIHNDPLKPPYLMKFFLNFLPWKLKRNTEWSLKCACHSAAFSGTECPLKGHWTVPEIRISVNIPWAFSGHSEMFQLTERRIFILCFTKIVNSMFPRQAFLF